MQIQVAQHSTHVKKKELNSDAFLLKNPDTMTKLHIIKHGTGISV